MSLVPCRPPAATPSPSPRPPSPSPSPPSSRPKHPETSELGVQHPSSPGVLFTESMLSPKNCPSSLQHPLSLSHPRSPCSSPQPLVDSSPFQILCTRPRCNTCGCYVHADMSLADLCQSRSGTTLPAAFYPSPQSSVLVGYPPHLSPSSPLGCRCTLVSVSLFKPRRPRVPDVVPASIIPSKFSSWHSRSRTGHPVLSSASPVLSIYLIIPVLGPTLSVSRPPSSSPGRLSSALSRYLVNITASLHSRLNPDPSPHVLGTSFHPCLPSQMPLVLLGLIYSQFSNSARATH